MKQQLIIIWVLLAILAGANIYTYAHFTREIDLTDRYAYALTEAVKEIAVKSQSF